MYAVATLKGAGLRDDDLTKAFANMIRQKLKKTIMTPVDL